MEPSKPIYIKEVSLSSGISSDFNTSATNLTSPNNENKRYANYEIPNTESFKSNLVHDEALAQEILSKAGPSYTYQRKDYSHDIGSLIVNSNNNTSSASIFTEQNNTKSTQSINNTKFDENCANIIKINPPNAYECDSNAINQDPDPIRVVKPNDQNIVYKQQVNIRYLQPPTPPPPAPIIIREKQLSPPPTQPPIIIRQTAPAPPTPPPLTIRERAPTPPPVLEPTIIERPVPPPPPPPRQVIIERVPAPPAKPRPIIYEKWLPYKSCERPVIVQKIKPSPITPPKNIIIEYESPKAVAVRQVIEEGIFKVDPATYESSQANGEIRIVDRITDLPIENSRILSQLNQESSNKNEKSHKFYTEMITSSNLLKANNCEYETITTSVPQSLAEKIIAEAQAAGVVTRSPNC